MSLMSEAASPAAAPAAPGRIDRAREFALGVEPRLAAKVLFTGIALMAVLGAGQRLGLPLGLFDFDGEGKPPALWSALVLEIAAALAVLVATSDDVQDKRRWFALGAFFAFMGLDEAAALHEHIDTDLGFDWQKGYAPLILIGGVAWILALRSMWHLVRARALWIGGALCWFISQVDEHFQSNPQDGRVRGYGALSGIEEVLEVTGSALFALALLVALHKFTRRRTTPAP